MQPLEQRHTGEYIAMKLSKILSDWDIGSEQVHCILRDNGSNMIKAMDEACLPSFGCFAHCAHSSVGHTRWPSFSTRCY